MVDQKCKSSFFGSKEIYFGDESTRMLGGDFLWVKSRTSMPKDFVGKPDLLFPLLFDTTLEQPHLNIFVVYFV